MARIVIIGGHGKIARLLEPLLVSAGHAVTAVIRDPGQAEAISATGATPLVADVEQLGLGRMVELIRHHDAVVFSAGAGGGNPARTYAVDRDAAIRSMDAAEQSGVRRYVMVSYFGARTDHGVEPTDPFFAYAEAKAAADAHLRTKDLDFTIVAPSTLTLDGPTGRIDVDASDPGSVPRADVAAVIAAVLADDSTIGRDIRFNSGDTPITDAVRA